MFPARKPGLFTLAVALRCVILGGLALGAAPAQIPVETKEAFPNFGVTVVAPFGFCGRIYELPENPSLSNACSAKLPNFQHLEPVGQIYSRQLSIPPREFREGFPGVTRRFEWFAINYAARFWIEKPGKYSFELLSDDGSALYIDGRRIINNDCMHPPISVSKSIRLDGGLHDMRVGYFQGPRWHVALVLRIRPPGEQWRIFNTDEFRPPPNPADWKYANSRNLNALSDPCDGQAHPRDRSQNDERRNWLY